MINTWIAVGSLIVAAVVWLVRLEGRINTIEAIVSRAETHFGRIETKLDQLMAQRCLPLTQFGDLAFETDRRKRERK